MYDADGARCLRRRATKWHAFWAAADRRRPTASRISAAMDVVRARWSSSSFLLYAGAFVVLFAMSRCSNWLSQEHSDGGFFGWSLLVWPSSGVVAIGFELAGERVAAGLFAFVSLVVFSVCSRLVRRSHRHPRRRRRRAVRRLPAGVSCSSPRVITAALILLARFRFPLLVLPVGLPELVLPRRPRLGRRDWSAIVSIFVGLVLMLVGAGADRIVRVLGPLRRRARRSAAASSTSGTRSTWEWILIGLIALVFFLFAGGLDRSIYAVLGAIGLFLSWTYFVEQWTDAEV